MGMGCDEILESRYKMNQTEFLTDPKNEHLVLFPIRNHDIWKLYKEFLASFWTVEEISNL